MKTRIALGIALFAVTLAACTQPTVIVPPPSTEVPATLAPTTPAPTRTSSPAPTATAAPTPSPTPSTAPGSTPNAACPNLTGAVDSQARAVITAIRIAHNPGFDRLVFELGPNAFGTYGMPPYTIQPASSFSGPSGLPVRVDGNAFFLVRLSNTDAHDQAGKVTVSSTDYKPTTPLIKEVRVVEDFEAVNRWAVGLDHLVCPSVLVLANPVRLVIDFPTPP